MVYNDGDQLVRWPGMYRYSYDGAGNLVEVKNDSQTQVLKSYYYTRRLPNGKLVYRYAGLLATATYKDKDGNDRTLVNTWDANSNRVSFSANGTEYELVYDITASIPAVIEESTSGSTVYYIREPGGALIARLSATDGTRYYHFDELGSTRLLTDADGNITNRYTYDAYGLLLSHDRYPGSVNQPYQYVGQLGYYTHWMEPDFGLLQLGVRFYDPEVGRFGQRDPIFDVASAPYLYAMARATRLQDPTGMRPGDYEECVAKYKRCLESAEGRFAKCIANSVGVSDLGTGVSKCIIGCGLLSRLIPGIYRACCAGCGALLTACSWIDLQSCQRVLDSEKSSCDSAFEYCKSRISRY